MARKHQDEAAAKAKKQKMILAVAGVALLGLAGIQGPKLMKQLNPPSSSSAAPAATAPADTTGSPIVPEAATPILGTAPVAASGPKAVLAGVTIGSGATAATDPGQLHSFSLFDPKDPFVQQASTDTGSGDAAAPTPSASDGKPAATNGAAAPAAPNASAAPGATAPKAAAPPVTNATILVNGTADYVALKEQFPKKSPLFVLVTLKAKVATIGVAGGTFADGKTIPLQFGKQITLVNDATGARYTLKLVYTGTTPEQTESFTQAKAG